jgi:hypothetical protein
VERRSPEPAPTSQERRGPFDGPDHGRIRGAGPGYPCGSARFCPFWGIPVQPHSLLW